MSKRNALDQYYLTPELFPLILEIIITRCIPETQYFMDTSAGRGEMIALLIKKFGRDRVFAYDIDPKGPFILSENFLDHDLLCSESTVTTICFPPFGTKGRLAIAFFNKCATVSKFIVTIFPKTAKKQYFQSQLDPHFHVIHESDLPHKSFVLNGKPHHVNCCFQIWEKLEYKRKIYKVKYHLTSPYFSFVDKHQNPDCAIINTGGKAGKILSCTEASEYAEKVVYYIKIHSDILKERDNIYKLDLSKVASNTVGQKGVSKPEIIYGIELLVIKLTLPSVI